MSTPFQNRLVGTIIVATAVVIFLPDMLDGNKKSYQGQFQPIPVPEQQFSGQLTTKFPQQQLQKLKQPVLSDEIASDETAIDDDNQAIAEPASTSANNKAKKASSTSAVSVTPATKADKINQISAVKPSKQAKPVESDKPVKASQKTAPNTRIPEKSVPQQAWAIQLGSFKHKKNVNELIDKLKNAGYTVFTRPIKTANGTLTKVFIGPELIKSTLEKQLAGLKKLTNVQGKVARFYPSK